MKLNCAFIIILLSCISFIEGQVRLCYSCRSRGKLGDCRDPFSVNATHLVPGVKAVPCASGWCSKTIDGDEHGEDHALATERECMQRPPPDLKHRCTQALFHHKRIFICFCQGTLCNSSSRVNASLLGFVLAAISYITVRQMY